MNNPDNTHNTHSTSVAQIHPALANNPNMFDVQAFQEPGIADAFARVQQEFINIDRRLARIEATAANTRILSDNQRLSLRYPIRPLKKYIDGDGHNFALAICGQATLPVAAQNFQPNAAVGDVPNPWDPEVDGYQLLDILQLAIFYNVDFGIVADDPVPTMRVKVRQWLLFNR